MDTDVEFEFLADGQSALDTAGDRAEAVIAAIGQSGFAVGIAGDHGIVEKILEQMHTIRFLRKGHGKGDQHAENHHQ